jgi:hypothetical protein
MLVFNKKMAESKQLDVWVKVTLRYGNCYGNIWSTQSSSVEYTMQRTFSTYKRCKPHNIANATDIHQWGTLIRMCFKRRNISYTQRTTIHYFADRLRTLFVHPSILKDNLKFHWDAGTTVGWGSKQLCNMSQDCLNRWNVIHQTRSTILWHIYRWQKYLQNHRSYRYTPLTVNTTVGYWRDRLN